MNAEKEDLIFRTMESIFPEYISQARQALVCGILEKFGEEYASKKVEEYKKRTSKKIKLELTEKEMNSLISIIDNASSALNEDEYNVRDVKKVDKMLLKNGFKRLYN